MFDWAVEMVRSMGYWGVVLLMFLENVFPPIPSEVVMPLAGFVASQEDSGMTLWWAVAAGTLGSVLGAIPLYYLGYAVGGERLKRWTGEHGRWLGVCPQDIDGAQKWFDRHGVAVVFFGRLVPGIRSLISIPAGVDRMNPGLFVLYSTLGAALWTTLLAWLGRLL